MIQLSIIIPIYNVEKYVEKCLRSCAEQDLFSAIYEIIIVNDGTKDESLVIAEYVAKEYSNIRIISQPNAGLSAARNKGFSLARGEYIWFIDSDDWIEKNCLYFILRICKLNKLDILHFKAIDVVNNNLKHRLNYPLNITNRVKAGRTVLADIIAYPCVQYNIFRRDFLQNNHLKFYTGIYHEDSEYTPRAFYYAKKVMVINKTFYYQFFNLHSITKTINPKKSHDLIKVCQSLHQFMIKVDNKHLCTFHNLISVYINNSLHGSTTMSKKEIRHLNNVWNSHTHLYVHLLKSTILKYRIEGVLFLILGRLGVSNIYMMIQKFNFRKE